MAHKVHPYGFRIGVNKPWLAKWYADRDYATLLQEDMRIRELVAKQLANASVSQVEIERGINHVTVTVHTAKPGIVIGKGGANVEALRTAIGKLTNKKVKLEIKEILQPELDGMLVAQNVAGQLERRIAFRKAIKQSIQRSIKAGAKGVKIQVSGRLGGAEMSRTEWDREGRIPLGTLRADISYGVVLARTTYGAIGVKAWVYRGDQLGERPGSARTEPRPARRGAPAAGGRGRTGGPRPTDGAPRPPRAPRAAVVDQEQRANAPAPTEATPTTDAAAAAPAAPEPITTTASMTESGAASVEATQAPPESATADQAAPAESAAAEQPAPAEPVAEPAPKSRSRARKAAEPVEGEAQATTDAAAEASPEATTSAEGEAPAGGEES